eukprot:gnl/MRDRNA2_/MRDRNA2_26174_c0_seq2.p1 gnl/MRDRNA2_/MRDRNA2_26174_c0~~gnl/MRDRNA2_/MRDRNA2_26174_c0_seq2.p1  ORF type:complete len:131 (+),score=20.86 gnl/MRDRNA2_/MRDRNA2_26174_c0_seq2:97-489(+)
MSTGRLLPVSRVATITENNSTYIWDDSWGMKDDLIHVDLVERDVKAIAAYFLDIDEGILHQRSRLEDHGADLNKLFSIFIALEEKFDILFDEEEAANVKSIEDFVYCIVETLTGGEQARKRDNITHVYPF